ncbi:DUF4258 domain-containing protein [Metallumcola ferriviriculae]|uniref:DUF4258 domain-containing protein n=1 Tax=Metallumcola ferriviriculae TaxID=3039180 RepID=A0AAU0UK12_9FIRM|nr:DUF4258 domain-containing protein [Desulfitibacteraceae bacterium MK1]
MDERKIDIGTITRLVAEDKMVWRNHILARMQQRGIKIQDVVDCILSGEIIEQYFDDYPYTSCLILGCTDKGRCIHTVCALGQDKVWMITTYFPDKEEWHDDFRTRRRKV